MLLKILRLGFYLKHITHLWDNYFLSVFPTFHYSATLPSLFLLFCVFHSLESPVCRMVLWLYIPFRKVNTWGLYGHLVRVPCSWPFPVWPSLGKDTLSSIPAWRRSLLSRYFLLCSRCRPSPVFSPLTAGAAFLGFSCSFSLLDRLLPHYCPDIYISFQIFLLA